MGGAEEVQDPVAGSGLGGQREIDGLPPVAVERLADDALHGGELHGDAYAHRAGLRSWPWSPPPPPSPPAGGGGAGWRRGASSGAGQERRGHVPDWRDLLQRRA